MPANDSVGPAYLTLDGYVELGRYRLLYFLLMLSAFGLILCSNSVIVSLIVVHRNLHEPMYAFIAALLVNSLLFSSAVYPKLLADVLSEKQLISYSACLFQFHVFYSLAGAEFLLLAAMAYDRYVSICEPLRYRSIMGRTSVCSFVLLAWLVPACLFAVSIAQNAHAKLCNFTFSGIICNSSVFKLHCATSQTQNIYGLFAFVCVVVLPVLFILFTYARILLLSCRSCRDVRRKAAHTCLPHLLVLLNFSCLSAYDVLLLRLENDFPKVVRLIMSLQILLYHPLFNPVIYGVKMKEINKHLTRLMCPGRALTCSRCSVVIKQRC